MVNTMVVEILMALVITVIPIPIVIVILKSATTINAVPRKMDIGIHATASQTTG